MKGLTGIDVPALIGSSMGARFGGNGAPTPSGSAPSGGSKGGGARALAPDLFAHSS